LSKKKEEFSIMNNTNLWRNERFPGSHRHEVFEGIHRQDCIKDGLVIYLTPELHNMSDKGIHFDVAFRKFAENQAKMCWMRYYEKTEEEFNKKYNPGPIEEEYREKYERLEEEYNKWYLGY
jgi:hypothetical protein